MCTTRQTILACGFAVAAVMQGCFNSPVEKDPTRSPTGTPTLQITKTPEVNFNLILQLDDEGALSHSVEAVQHEVSEIFGVNKKHVRVDAHYAISTECAITGVGINETENVFATIFQVDQDAVLVDKTRRLAKVSTREHNITVTITSENKNKANSIYKVMETNLGAAWSEQVSGGNLEKQIETRVEVEMQVSIASDTGVLPDKDEIGTGLVEKGIKAEITIVTSAPTKAPAKQPTTSPAEVPTATPSEAPTTEPTAEPTSKKCEIWGNKSTTFPTDITVQEDETCGPFVLPFQVKGSFRISTHSDFAGILDHMAQSASLNIGFKIGMSNDKRLRLDVGTGSSYVHALSSGEHTLQEDVWYNFACHVASDSIHVEVDGVLGVKKPLEAWTATVGEIYHDGKYILGNDDCCPRSATRIFNGEIEDVLMTF